MALTAIKTTAGYIVEGTDAVGKDVELFFDSSLTAGYDHLVSVEDNFLKQQEFNAERAKLPDPERDLYLKVFGAGQENTDKVLHTTLLKPVDRVDGLSIDWTRDSVTVALRLIEQGESGRLRLIDGQLVDLGPQAKAKKKAKK